MLNAGDAESAAALSTCAAVSVNISGLPLVADDSVADSDGKAGGEAVAIGCVAAESKQDPESPLPEHTAVTLPAAPIQEFVCASLGESHRLVETRVD